MKNWAILILFCYTAVATIWMVTQDEQQDPQVRADVLDRTASEPERLSAAISEDAPGQNESSWVQDDAHTRTQSDTVLSEDINAGSSEQHAVNEEDTAHADIPILEDTPRGQPLVAEDAAELAALELQSAREYAAHVDSYLQGEEVDMTWSEQANSEITHVFASDPLQNSSLLSVECRSTLCKVEVWHGDDYDQESFEMSMAESFVETLPQGTMIRDPSVPNVSVIYMARKGHSLPRNNSMEAF